MQKLDFVDSLRGIAILLVISIHCTQHGNFNVGWNLFKFASQGITGVQLFFVASAFTLFLSYSHRGSKERSPVKNFYIRRFFRIAPLFYLGIIYYSFQDGLEGITSLNILSHFTFTNSFSPYWINNVVPGSWSIGVEVIFYAILPFLFSRIKTLNQSINFIIIALLFRLASNYILKSHHPIISAFDWKQFLYYYFPNQLPVFALGIIMYFLIFPKEENSYLIPGKTLLLLSVILILPIFSYLSLTDSDHITVSFAYVILGVGLSKFPIKFIVNPILRKIGMLSFSIYLIHFAVLYWMDRFHMVDYPFNYSINYFIRIIIVTIISSCIAMITYNLIEVPFQKLGKKFIVKIDRRLTIKEETYGM